MVLEVDGHEGPAEHRMGPVACHRALGVDNGQVVHQMVQAAFLEVACHKVQEAACHKVLEAACRLACRDACREACLAFQEAFPAFQEACLAFQEACPAFQEAAHKVRTDRAVRHQDRQGRRMVLEALRMARVEPRSALELLALAAGKRLGLPASSVDIHSEAEVDEGVAEVLHVANVAGVVGVAAAEIAAAAGVAAVAAVAAAVAAVAAVEAAVVAAAAVAVAAAVAPAAVVAPALLAAALLPAPLKPLLLQASSKRTPGLPRCSSRPPAHSGRPARVDTSAVW